MPSVQESLLKHNYFSVLAAALLLSACTTVQVSKPPAFSCSPDIVVTKELRTVPKVTATETTSFLEEDPQAVALLSCSNLSGKHTVRWEWYANGLPYLISREAPFNSPERSFVRDATASHSVNIRGERAAEKPGDWQIRAYLDGALIGQKNFTITAELDLIEQVKKLPVAQPDYSRHALIIGIEKYSETVPAKYADRDALLMKEFFNHRYGVPERNITTLINEEATLNRIRNIVENKLQALGKNDTLFVYYSGHGTAVPDREGNGAAIPYIIPNDGDPNNPASTAYPLQQFYESLNKLRANNVVVFLDSCFSGVTGRTSSHDKVALATGVKAVEFPIIKDPLLFSEKVIGISSSESRQISNNAEKERHGLFTTHLVKEQIKNNTPMMTGGTVTVGKLFDQVKETVNDASLKLYGLSRIQTPTMHPEKGDERLNLRLWSRQ
jgi:hypothetical protein